MGGSSLCARGARAARSAPRPGACAHVLDRPSPSAVAPPAARRSTRDDAVRRLLQVGRRRSRRSPSRDYFATYDARAARGDRRGRATSSRSPIPARRSSSSRRAAATGACSSNPPDIGGRYSALSYFGLVPAALLGIDLGALLDARPGAWRRPAARGPDGREPGLVLGALLGELARARARQAHARARSAARGASGAGSSSWWPRARARTGTGIVPVAGEPLGAPGVYGADRVFVAFGSAEPADAATEARSTRSRRPAIRCSACALDEPATLGARVRALGGRDRGRGRRSSASIRSTSRTSARARRTRRARSLATRRRHAERGRGDRTRRNAWAALSARRSRTAPARLPRGARRAATRGSRARARGPPARRAAPGEADASLRPTSSAVAEEAAGSRASASRCATARASRTARRRARATCTRPDRCTRAGRRTGAFSSAHRRRSGRGLDRSRACLVVRRSV